MNLAAPHELQRRDVLTGLFVLASLGVMVGTLVITSGVLERQYDLYMRTASAQDLTKDTRVLLQGLEVGRVRQVNPVMDSTTGHLSFVARLSINDEFPNGAQVRIPRGTHAVIEQLNPIAAPVIQLLVPAGARGGAVEPGDTIQSERRAGAVDALSQIAEDLSTEVRETIRETRTLVRQTTRAATEAEHLVSVSTPRVEQVLDQLAQSLERTDRILAEIRPRVGPLQDSLIAVLADTRQALRRVNDLASTAQQMTIENRTSIQETIQHLHNSAVLIEHFADQVSRRPTRLLTGVEPPRPDTGKRP